MADFLSIPQSGLPATPVKSGVNVSTQEVSDYSPAPQYAAHDGQKDASTKAEAYSTGFVDTSKPYSTGFFPDGKVNILPIPEHPDYPIGDFTDVKTHMECQRLFTSNIELFIKEFISMRQRLGVTETKLNDAEAQLWSERTEKERAQAEAADYKAMWEQAKLDLQITRDELIDVERRLASAIEHLRITVDRLNKVQEDLKDRTRERDDLKRRVAELDRQVAFYVQRTTHLQLELDAANRSEDAANEREARLTKVLYEVEGTKARIERERESLNRKIFSLEVKQEDMEREIRRLNECLRNGGHDSKELEELRREREALRNERKQLLEDHEELEKKLAQLGEECTQLRVELAGLTEERQGLITERDQLVDRCTELNDKLTKAEQDYSNVEYDLRMSKDRVRKHLGLVNHLPDVFHGRDRFTWEEWALVPRATQNKIAKNKRPKGQEPADFKILSTNDEVDIDSADGQFCIQSHEEDQGNCSYDEHSECEDN